MTEQNADTIALIKEALGNALENGYDFAGWSIEEIACDLMAYCADFEEWELDDLMPLVEQAYSVEN